MCIRDRWSPPEEAKDTGTVTMDGRIFLGGKLLEPKPVEELRQTLAWARQNRDWDNYRKAILELGVTGTPEAQALLVEIMGDETLFMPGPWLGQDFYKVLRESEVDGILQAARARAEIDLKEKADSRWRGRGWLSLVALHGGEAELDWIASLGTSGNRTQEVHKAFAEGARNPLTAARLAASIEAGKISFSPGYLDTFARENPEAAFRAAANGLRTHPAGPRDELLGLLGSATRDSTIGDAANLLLASEEIGDRIDAIEAVERMRRAGLDVSRFQPLLDDLRAVLERAARGELDPSEKLVSHAISTAENCQCAWDEPTLAALRALASVPNERARKALAKIEKKATEGGWLPERG